MQRQGASPMRTCGPSKLECRTCCNPRLPNVTLASLAPQARITSRTCESAASCCAQPPLASPRRILHSGFLYVRVVTATFRPKSARALRHRESQRVERAGFGLRHGRLRARHSAYTPLPKRGIALSFSIVKSFKQFRALPNWFVLNRLCGCSASRARLGTKAHFGDGRISGLPHGAVAAERARACDGRTQARQSRWVGGGGAAGGPQAAVTAWSEWSSAVCVAAGQQRPPAATRPLVRGRGRDGGAAAPGGRRELCIGDWRFMPEPQRKRLGSFLVPPLGSCLLRLGWSDPFRHLQSASVMGEQMCR